MVGPLGLRNFSKRITYAASENTPPAKPGYNAHLHVIQDSARRRRARTAGRTRTPRYTVEQAKRRSITTTSVHTIRFEVPATQDVDMHSVPAPKPNTVPITLPSKLDRPAYKDISPDALRAVLPDLADVHPDYVHEHLQHFGPGMLKVLSTTQITPPPAQSPNSALPKELSLLINDLSSELPTHILAVYAPASQQKGKNKVTLYPTHNVVLASHCAHLPPLPTIPSPEAASSSSTPMPLRLTVPVLPLCLPSPQTFPLLSAYLYTKRTAPLLSALLPPGCPLPPSASSSAQPNPSTPQHDLPALQTMLAHTYTPHALLASLHTLTGLWRNACALGVFEPQLWGAMDAAWELLVGALARATGASP